MQGAIRTSRTVAAEHATVSTFAIRSVLLRPATAGKVRVSYETVPELPEVETIARGLANAVVGKTVAAVRVSLARIVVAPPGVDFAAALGGETITGVGRRAKYVVIELASGARLVAHPRMTGRLIVQGPGSQDPYPHTHVVLTFTDGWRLCYADARTFGRLRFLRVGEAWDAHGGVEPLSEGFTSEVFVSMLDERRTPIKVLLLDQKRISGIGNIYACEALWEAGIAPNRPAHTISKPARRRLHQAIQGVLLRSIEARGTSVDDYVDADGLKGGFQNQLSVYGRLDEPCSRCGKPIVRTVIGQRGTWWCRRCQK